MARLPVTDELNELVNDWMSELRDHRRLSNHSCASYLRDVRQFLEFLNQHLGLTVDSSDLSSLHIRDLRAFLAARRSHAQNRSLARSLSALRSFDAFLQKRGIPPCAALKNIQSPKQSHRLPRPVEAQSVINMIALEREYDRGWQGTRNIALLTLLYGCGLRISEALALRVSDIENARSRQVLRIRGKGDKPRDVPLLPLVMQALEDYAASYPRTLEATDLFFRGPRGAFSARQAQYMVARLRRMLGLPDSVTPHALRHSFASHMLSGGADLRTIQELLGHASLSSTQVYTEIDQTQLRDVYERAHPRALKG